jgi:hypothetical protein
MKRKSGHDGKTRLQVKPPPLSGVPYHSAKAWIKEETKEIFQRVPRDPDQRERETMERKKAAVAL